MARPILGSRPSRRLPQAPGTTHPCRLHRLGPALGRIPLVRHLDPLDPDRIFVAVEEGWIVRSDDRGQTWENIPLSVAIDPADPDTYLVGMTDGTLWMSEDGASSFRPVLEGLPPITGITFAPSEIAGS